MSEKEFEESMKLTRKEVEYLSTLIKGEKSNISLLRGFRKPTQEEQDENAYYNKLIDKLYHLTNNTHG